MKKPNLEILTRLKPAAKPAAVLIVAGALFVGGMKYDQSIAQKKLPANAQCQAMSAAVKEGLKVFQAQMIAAIDGETSVDPDLSAVRDASKACHANSGIVTVKVEDK